MLQWLNIHIYLLHCLFFFQTIYQGQQQVFSNQQQGAVAGTVPMNHANNLVFSGNDTSTMPMASEEKITSGSLPQLNQHGNMAPSLLQQQLLSNNSKSQQQTDAFVQQTQSSSASRENFINSFVSNVTTSQVPASYLHSSATPIGKGLSDAIHSTSSAITTTAASSVATTSFMTTKASMVSGTPFVSVSSGATMSPRQNFRNRRPSSEALPTAASNLLVRLGIARSCVVFTT